MKNRYARNEKNRKGRNIIVHTCRNKRNIYGLESPSNNGESKITKIMCIFEIM